MLLQQYWTVELLNLCKDVLVLIETWGGGSALATLTQAVTTLTNFALDKDSQGRESW